jgi:hypothetical protein
MAQKIIKATLVFIGLKKEGGNWKLCFANKNDSIFLFNAQQSNTTPYVFYNTAADKSLKENEKIKGSWFVISYLIYETGKKQQKIITRIDAEAGL